MSLANRQALLRTFFAARKNWFALAGVRLPLSMMTHSSASLGYLGMLLLLSFVIVSREKL